MPGGDEGERVRVFQREAAHVVGEPLQEGLPPVIGFHPGPGFDLDRAHQLLDDAFEEVFSAVDVPVERHRLHLQGRTERTHRQRGHPVMVDHLDGRLDDQLPAQTPPG